MDSGVQLDGTARADTCEIGFTPDVEPPNKRKQNAVRDEDSERHAYFPADLNILSPSQEGCVNDEKDDEK